MRYADVIRQARTDHHSRPVRYAYFVPREQCTWTRPDGRRCELRPDHAEPCRFPRPKQERATQVIEPEIRPFRVPQRQKHEHPAPRPLLWSCGCGRQFAEYDHLMEHLWFPAVPHKNRRAHFAK